MAVRASNAKTFTFQITKIWEGSSDNLDTTQKPVDVKHKNEAGARRKLPKADLGRYWVLIAIDGEKVKR